MNSFRPRVIVLSMLFFGIFSACHKADNNRLIALEFSHSVGNKAFIKDNLQYVNAAGNHYKVSELQYFISNVTLLGSDGSSVPVAGGIHYVDIDIPQTLNWNCDIPAGDYVGVSFTFGIDEAMNKPGLFVNAPERDMFWPDIMGGGYHYMKMNGYWLDPLNQLTPFNFHMGIGMVDDGMGGKNFVQNYFRVQIPISGGKPAGDQKIVLNMDIASWFDTPNLWDWNVIGGAIMQKQWAMQKASENGRDAFSCRWR